MLDRLRGALGLAAAHGELRAAARDTDVERRLDLAQVLVERAAQAREALVVDGIELDLDGLGSQTSSPLREWGRAAVIVTRANSFFNSSGPAKLTTRLLPVR